MYNVMYTLPEIRYTSTATHVAPDLCVRVRVVFFNKLRFKSSKPTGSSTAGPFQTIVSLKYKNERALSNRAIWSDATSEVLGSVSPDFPCKDVRVHRVPTCWPSGNSLPAAPSRCRPASHAIPSSCRVTLTSWRRHHRAALPWEGGCATARQEPTFSSAGDGARSSRTPSAASVTRLGASRIRSARPRTARLAQAALSPRTAPQMGLGAHL